MTMRESSNGIAFTVIAQVNSDPSIGIFGTRLRKSAEELILDSMDIGLKMASLSGADKSRSHLVNVHYAQSFIFIRVAGEDMRFEEILEESNFTPLYSMQPEASPAKSRAIIRRLLLQCGVLAINSYAVSTVSTPCFVKSNILSMKALSFVRIRKVPTMAMDSRSWQPWIRGLTAQKRHSMH